MRFVLLSDLHFARSSRPEIAAARDRVFAAVFRQVAAEQANAVFVLGDVAHRGRISELTRLHEIAHANGLALTAVVGNHDADNHSKAELAPFFLGTHKTLSQTALYTAFSAGSVRFALLDTAREMSVEVYDGFVAEAHQTWLADEIVRANADSTIQYFIALGHHPIANTTARSDEPGLNIANSADVTRIFGGLRGKSGLYLCGHNHRHSIAGPDGTGWHFVQTGALLLCQSYRILTVDAHGLRIETVDVDMSSPGLSDDWATVCANFEDLFSLYPRAEVNGEPHDHSLVLPG